MTPHTWHAGASALNAPDIQAASPVPAQFQPFGQSPAGRARLIHGSFEPPSLYGISVGFVDGSHTSLLVATSSFMLRHVRLPGNDRAPSTTARA